MADEQELYHVRTFRKGGYRFQLLLCLAEKSAYFLIVVAKTAKGRKEVLVNRTKVPITHPLVVDEAAEQAEVDPADLAKLERRLESLYKALGIKS